MNTEIFNHVQWLHILAATIGYFLLGALWYSALFQKQWIAAAGIDMNNPDGKKGVGAIMVLSFLLMFICSFGLSILISKLQIGSWQAAVKLGLFTGVCFSAATISICYVYEKKPLALHLINGGYNLVGQIIASLILTLWK